MHAGARRRAARVEQLRARVSRGSGGRKALQRRYRRVCQERPAAADAEDRRDDARAPPRHELPPRGEAHRARAVAGRRADVPHAGQMGAGLHRRRRTPGARADRFFNRRETENSRPRSLAAGAAARSQQSRLRQGRGDRARREALLRSAPLGHGLGALRDLPCALPLLPGRAGARLRPGGRGPQHAEPGECRLVPLVRLGRRARQPLGAKHPAAARSARDAGEPGACGFHDEKALFQGVRESLLPQDAGGRRRGHDRRRQGARRLPGDAGQRPHALRRVPRRAGEEFLDPKLSSRRAAGTAHLRRQGQLRCVPLRPAFHQRRVRRHRNRLLRRQGARRPRPPWRHSQAAGEPL